MDIDTLNERKKFLNVQLQDAGNRLSQAQADVQCIDGALQEVDYWLNLLNSKNTNVGE
jgi:hypothetical protein